jgi:predicted N-acyltransferase
LKYQFSIFNSSSELPDTWDDVAQKSLFLQSAYLRALENSTPDNISCQFIGVFQDEELVATVMLQQVDLAKLAGFGNRDRGIINSIRNFLFKRFASKLAIVGNNMLTGQHAISFGPDANQSAILNSLKQHIFAFAPTHHMHVFKDFEEHEKPFFDQDIFQKSLLFSSQPAMILELNSSWDHEADYVQALTKKYRDQYKRARKKAEGIEKRQLSAEEIWGMQVEIHKLYQHVADNAPFNTFFLTKNHFYSLKKELGQNFRFYAYFDHGRLIGFNTLIQHHETLETYFLGYDEKIQREKMLYLNMLYDMVGCGIKNGFTCINFGRTALEIKSSVGAKPKQLFGWMNHQNTLINKNLAFFFKLLEPEAKWTQRHPFKS